MGVVKTTPFLNGDEMEIHEKCPNCGHVVTTYKNPLPTVDAAILVPGRKIVLIKRKNPPHGWALPGGFVNYGESVEDACIREAKEETRLDIRIMSLLGVFSNPIRDPRKHIISTVFIAKADNIQDLKASDDAADIGVFPIQGPWPDPICFDHMDMLNKIKKLHYHIEAIQNCSDENT